MQQSQAQKNRNYYIDGRLEFGLFDKGEKTTDEILNALYEDRDFKSMVRDHYPEWKTLHVQTITNPMEIYLTSKKK